MKTPVRALIVEDSEFDARVLVTTLRQGGYSPSFKRVENAPAMMEALRAEPWDIVLCDYNLPEFNAPEALRLLQGSGLDLPFIIISGGIGEDVAAASMKAGAHDYLMKGNLARLAPAVERELREAATRRARRDAEDALRESEQRYRLLWENSADAVLWMRADGVIRFANPAVESVFGYSPDQVVGRPFTGLLSQEAGPRFTRWVESYLGDSPSSSGRKPIETLGCHKERGEISIEIAFSQVEIHGGPSLVAFVRDISERKRAEEEIRLLQGISLAVNAAPDLHAALSVVLHAVCDATGWALGQAWLPTADGRCLECSSAWHTTRDDLRPFREVSVSLRPEPGVGLPGRVWKERKPVWLRDLSALPNSPRAPVALRLGILSSVGIPVMTEDQLVAVLEFFLLEARDEDARLIKLISAIAAQLGTVIQHKRAEQELRQNEEQFRVAREIQTRLFPKNAPEVPGFDIAGMSRPAEAAGGDYFDYLPMAHNRLGVVVGDVTGHGIGPALLMAETRAYLRVLASGMPDTSSILTSANKVLAEDIGSERFITMLLVCLDPHARTLWFSNAGHPTGYVLNAAGQVTLELGRSGPPLGIRSDTRYPPAQRIQLMPGDLILLLTDGIDEAMSPDDEIFGVERTLETIRANLNNRAAVMVQALYDAVRGFAQDRPQLDDATVAIIKVN